MTSSKQMISAVPTNIISGFLGVGKTSVILHLLKNKPINQRWAILVNEFGEIGVDGSLFQGQHSGNQGVFIRELPGGCMCCAAGLPMHIALNELLKWAKPDRLLIEPTGLGHPLEVLKILSAAHYQEVLSLHKIITLVDARKLADTRYTGHETFNQQIAIADIVIGNKLDLYQPYDKSELRKYVKQQGAANAEVIFTQHGVIESHWLQGATAATTEHLNSDQSETKPGLFEIPIPPCGYIKAMNEGEGFYSVGWRFESSIIFDYLEITSFLNGIIAERMKAVMITERGAFGYNLTSDALTELELDECTESRIEIIAFQTDDAWESQLMQCIRR